MGIYLTTKFFLYYTNQCIFIVLYFILSCTLYCPFSKTMHHEEDLWEYRAVPHSYYQVYAVEVNYWFEHAEMFLTKLRMPAALFQLSHYKPENSVPWFFWTFVVLLTSDVAFLKWYLGSGQVLSRLLNTHCDVPYRENDLIWINFPQAWAIVLLLMLMNLQYTFNKVSWNTNTDEIFSFSIEWLIDCNIENIFWLFLVGT